MPEIKFPSDFLKIGDNVQDGDLVVFKDSGVLDDDGERYIFNMEVVHDGVPTETKKFTLNRTNFKAVAALYGTNSDAWIGKEMLIGKVVVRNPGTGLMVNSIALLPPLAK